MRVTFASPHKLPHRRHAVFFGGVDGFAQRDGFEVVAAADFRFRLVFQGAQELGHGADEGFREPDFLPAAVDPRGDKLYVTWNASRGSRAWDSCALTVVHIPESERE
jgi:hypothetical protein